MQETTFHSLYQSNGDDIYGSVSSWLDALYGEASQKNILKGLDLNKLSTFESIRKLQHDLGYDFNNKELLINALVQSTFCYEYKEINITSNERLEFLGDSVVNFIMASTLYKLYPQCVEGELSKLRGALVNEHSLARLGETLLLGENLLLGKGEFRNQGSKKDSLLANAFEALIGAVYIDSHYSIETVERAIAKIINAYESKTKKDFFSLANLESFDYKTQLQELSMALFKTLPTYKAFEEKNGLQGFLVELWIGDKLCAQGRGASKKKLEKELARVVLDEKRYQ